MEAESHYMVPNVLDYHKSTDQNEGSSTFQTADEEPIYAEIPEEVPQVYDQAVVETSFGSSCDGRPPLPLSPPSAERRGLGRRRPAAQQVDSPPLTMAPNFLVQRDSFHVGSNPYSKSFPFVSLGGTTEGSAPVTVQHRCDLSKRAVCVIVAGLVTLVLIGVVVGVVVVELTKPPSTSPEESSTTFASFTFPTTTTTTGPTPCLNGGVSHNDTCYCAVLFTGTLCEKIVCRNGGTPYYGQTCECSRGWSGTHCTIEQCTSTLPNVISGPNERSLTFVVQTTVGAAPILNSLQEYIGQLLSLITAESPTWITKYTLITFNSNKYEAKISTQSPTLFSNYIKSIQATDSDGALCPKPITAAVLQAVNGAEPYSMIWVFTDSVPSDFQDFMTPLYAALQGTNPSLNFVVSAAYPLQPCGFPIGSEEVRIFFNLATLTDGHVFLVDKASLLELYNTGLALASQGMDCTTHPQYLYFPVDSHAEQFTLVVSGYLSNFTLETPNVAQITGDTYPGMWRLEVGTASQMAGCRVQVWVKSDLQIYTGFTTNPHINYGYPQPISNTSVDNYMVTHARGLSGGGQLEYVEVVDSAHQLKDAAPMTPRSSLTCSYEYISQTLLCPKGISTINVNGLDERGYLFQRIRGLRCQFQNLGMYTLHA